MTQPIVYPETYFPNFYANPCIQALYDTPIWTISDVDKMPVHMGALLHNGVLHGARFDDPSATITLREMSQQFPLAANVACFTNPEQYGWVVIDIESTCPTHIKEQLCSIPHIYAEYSRSGNGIHLIVPTPASYNAPQYSAAQTKPALKEGRGYYEILQHHWVTFTRNECVLPARTAQLYADTPDSLLDITYRGLAENAQLRNATSPQDIDDLEAYVHRYDDTDVGAYFDDIIECVTNVKYPKTPDDFNGDHSRWEFGCTSYYNSALTTLLGTRYNNLTLSREIREVLLYRIIHQIIPYRTKHDEYRLGMPWLLYNVNTVLDN